MADVTPSSVKTSSTGKPNDNTNKNLDAKQWEPKDGSSVVVDLKTPQKVDVVVLDDKNSNQPQTFSVSIWLQPPKTEKPEKEVQ